MCGGGSASFQPLGARSPSARHTKPRPDLRSYTPGDSRARPRCRPVDGAQVALPRRGFALQAYRSFARVIPYVAWPADTLWARPRRGLGSQTPADNGCRPARIGCRALPPGPSLPDCRQPHVPPGCIARRAARAASIRRCVPAIRKRHNNGSAPVYSYHQGSGGVDPGPATGWHRPWSGRCLARLEPPRCRGEIDLRDLSSTPGPPDAGSAPWRNNRALTRGAAPHRWLPKPGKPDPGNVR